MPARSSRFIEGAILFFLFSFVLLISAHLPGHESDMGCWRGWTKHIRLQGLRNAYDSDNNYPLLYQYMMWAFGKLFSNPDSINNRIGYIRIFSLFFEALGLWYVYQWIDKRTSFFLLCLFSLLNLSFSYNTVIWGQVDAIMTTLVFAALYYAYQKKIVISSAFMILALNMKLQSLVFIPVWGILCLLALPPRKWIKQTGFSLLVMLTIQGLLLLPFLLHHKVDKVASVLLGSFNYYPKVSMNAYNFWYLVVKSPGEVYDGEKFIGSLTYKQTGLLLFFCLSAVVLWPLLFALWQKWKKKTVLLKKETVWLCCGAISLLFFYCNTQMHERYCHPAFLFLTAYAFYKKQFLLYALFSVTYFLQMEAVLGFLHLPATVSFLFGPKLISILFFTVLIGLAVSLYKEFFRKDNWAKPPALPTNHSPIEAL